MESVDDRPLSDSQHEIVVQLSKEAIIKLSNSYVGDNYTGYKINDLLKSVESKSQKSFMLDNKAVENV